MTLADPRVPRSPACRRLRPGPDPAQPDSVCEAHRVDCQAGQLVFAPGTKSHSHNSCRKASGQR